MSKEIEQTSLEEEKPKGKKLKKNYTKQDKLSSIKVIDIPYGDLRVLDEGYKEKLETDPKYSLSVDPLNVYNMTQNEIDFVNAYVQLKSIGSVSKLLKITEEDAMEIFASFNVQQEIKRINMAMYSRQFSQKMLTIDEIGGYLTSMISDENVGVVDRLTSKDKLEAAKILIQINQLKKESYENPSILNNIDIEKDLSQLSTKSIKMLISNCASSEEKNEIIDKINCDNKLTQEELANLRSMSLKDLLELLDKINRSKS